MGHIDLTAFYALYTDNSISILNPAYSARHITTVFPPPSSAEITHVVYCAEQLVLLNSNG
jgi:hypothetical protein